MTIQLKSKAIELTDEEASEVLILLLKLKGITVPSPISYPYPVPQPYPVYPSPPNFTPYNPSFIPTWTTW